LLLEKRNNSLPVFFFYQLVFKRGAFMEALLTVKEAAEITRLKTKTLYAYAERRIIPHIKLGSRLFFTREKLEGWIESNSVPSIDARKVQK
jgi:excisionase family DNA binding protein